MSEKEDRLHASIRKRNTLIRDQQARIAELELLRSAIDEIQDRGLSVERKSGEWWVGIKGSWGARGRTIEEAVSKLPVGTKAAREE